jgi:hypothetical protein
MLGFSLLQLVTSELGAVVVPEAQPAQSLPCSCGVLAHPGFNGISLREEGCNGPNFKHMKFHSNRKGNQWFELNSKNSFNSFQIQRSISNFQFSFEIH